MDTPHDRLKAARERAGYKSAKAAAEAMGVPVSTYVQHESGLRPFPQRRAHLYGEAFNVKPEWLLFRAGEVPPTRTLDESPKLDRIVLAPEKGRIGEWSRVVRGDSARAVPVMLPPGLPKDTRLFAFYCPFPIEDSELSVPMDSFIIAADQRDIGLHAGDIIVKRAEWEDGTQHCYLQKIIAPEDAPPGPTRDALLYVRGVGESDDGRLGYWPRPGSDERATREVHYGPETKVGKDFTVGPIIAVYTRVTRPTYSRVLLPPDGPLRDALYGRSVEE